MLKHPRWHSHGSYVFQVEKCTYTAKTTVNMTSLEAISQWRDRVGTGSADQPEGRSGREFITKALRQSQAIVATSATQ